ncbi:MAG: hypothetical protein EAZ97_08970 [Bacteroidetes bacterium]|nr:MAG: hypothetical protein EAZ97_08970 [Bacteroidota bacterium]
MKYTIQTLKKLENQISESGFHLRYEKGSFKAGYCVLKQTKIVIVNQFATLEGKINCLQEIIKIWEESKEILD